MGNKIVVAENKKISIMTLNINTGHGNSKNLVQKLKEKELIDNLNKISEVIKRERPDVVCLQEVDINWRHTYNINQAIYIAEKSGYKYFAYFVFHRRIKGKLLNKVLNVFYKNAYISTAFDRDLGMAILSNYEIKNTGFYRFGNHKNEKLDWIKNVLEETKGYMFADIVKDNVVYTIINVHLMNDILGIIRGIFKGEFRFKGGKFREKQVKILIKHLEEKFKNKNLIVAGDFNSIPQHLNKTYYEVRPNGYEVIDDYSDDKAIETFGNYWKGLGYSLPPVFNMLNCEDYFTFPSRNPLRPLDYIFIPELKEYKVIKDVVSDHLAVIAEGCC
jgi:endonuclease/exonuclease/phosphatase family metal-dependent hydrolase